MSRNTWHVPRLCISPQRNRPLPSRSPTGIRAKLQTCIVVRVRIRDAIFRFPSFNIVSADGCTLLYNYAVCLWTYWPWNCDYNTLIRSLSFFRYLAQASSSVEPFLSVKAPHLATKVANLSYKYVLHLSAWNPCCSYPFANKRKKNVQKFSELSTNA